MDVIVVDEILEIKNLGLEWECNKKRVGMKYVVLMMIGNVCEKRREMNLEIRLYWFLENFMKKYEGMFGVDDEDVGSVESKMV